MLISPAYAQAASGGSDFLIQLMPILLMFVIFYMLLLRPQQQRVKAPHGHGRQRSPRRYDGYLRRLRRQGHEGDGRSDEVEVELSATCACA